MYLGLVHQADGDGPGGNHLVGAVEGDTEKMLLFPVTHVTDQREHIGGKCDLEPFGPDAATGEFQGSRDQGGLGRTDPVNARKILHRRIGAGFIQNLQDALCQGHDRVRSGAAAQKDGQEFLVGQGLRAFLLELLPGAIQ